MTITVKLEPELEARLRARIAESGQTLSEFVRDALVAKLDATDDDLTPYEAWLKYFRPEEAEGPPDDVTSENLSEKIRESLIAKHRAR